MAWTPPSDAVETQASSDTAGWTPPNDAVKAGAASVVGWTPPADAVTTPVASKPQPTEAPAEEPGFFGRLKKSFLDVGVPQAQAGLQGLTVVAQGNQIAKTADRLKGLEAKGEGESKEAQGLRKTLDFYTKRQGTYFQDLAAKQKELQGAPTYPGVRKLSEAKTFSEGFKTFAQDPVNIVANLTAQSLPTAVPALIAGVINPKLGAAVYFGSSYGVEFGGSFLEGARDNGINTSDPKQMASLFEPENKELLREIVNKAGTRAGIVASGDALLGGLASKTLVPKRITGPVAKNVANMGAQVGAQSVGGGGVEAIAQAVTEGEITKPGEILAEAFGGLGTAPLDVYAMTRKAARDAKKEQQAAEEDRKPIEPTFDDLDLKPKVPSTEERVAALAKKYSLTGMVDSDAEALARRKIAEQDAEVAKAAGIDEVVAETPAETTPADTVEPTAAEVVTEEVAEEPAAPTLESLTGELIDQGFPEDEARVLAQMRLDKEKPIVTQPTQAPSSIITREAPPTIESLTSEFVDQGFSEDEARVLAQIAIERDTRETTERKTDAVGTVAAPSGVGTELAERVGGESTTGGPRVTEPGGVVSAEQDAGRADAGEGTQPFTVTSEDQARALTDKQLDTLLAEHTFARDDDNEYKLLKAEQARRGQTKTVDVSSTLDYFEKRDALIKQLDAVSEESSALLDKIFALDSLTPESVLGADGKPLVLDENGKYDSDKRYEAIKTLRAERDKASAKFDTLIKQIDDLDAARAAAKKTTTETTGEPLGTKTTETVETEEKGQAAPAAAGVAPAKPKRGRPVTLTPEEKAATEAEKKEDRAARGRHKRAVDKAETSLQKALAPLDEGEFANEAELKEAQDDQRAERRNAVKELLRVSEESGLKPEGKRARQILRDAKIPQTEIDDIKRGLERAKKALADKTNLLGPVSSTERKGAAVTKADPAFAAFKNGAQAIGHIIKTGTRFQKAIAKRLRNFVRDVEFVVLEQDSEIPAQLQQAKYAPQWERSRALYIENFKTGKRVVYVRGASFGNSQGANNVTVLHELLHAATVKKIALAQEYINKGINLTSPLVRAYQDLLDTMRAAQNRLVQMSDDGEMTDAIADLYESTDGDIVADPREFLAYGMSEEQFQEFLMTAEGVQEDTSFFTRFVDSIRRMFGMDESDINALSDLIKATDSLLTARIPRGEAMSGTSATAQQKSKGEESNDKLAEKAERSVEELDKAQRIAKRKVAESRLGTEAQAEGMKLMQLARDPKKVLDALKSAWTTASYAQRQVMVKLPTLDVLADWTKDSVPRIGDVQRHIQEMNGMSVKFLEGAQHVIGGLRSVFKALPQERVALENLVLETTLTRYDPADPKLKVRNAALDADYNDLSPASQGAYRMLRDYYEGVHDLFTLLLDQQIENLTDVSAEIKQNLMVMIRKSFESGDRIKPFFPLVRRGDFWVSTGKGDARQFYMFENMAARDKFAKTLGGNVATGNDLGELRRATQDSSTLLKEMFDAIDKQDLADANVKEDLKDAVYQIYLQTMPDQSFRKMFIHRKDVSGFSTDLVRNTASTASRMATQLAKLKYAPILRNDLSAARSSIEGRPELTPFVQEAQRRVNAALSGESGGIMDAVAGLANKASYLWYMSSASSALIQPFSVYVSGLPILAANHGGNWLGAAQELGKMLTYLNQYGVTRQNADGTLSYTSPSIANNPNLPEDEIRAVKAMTERGVQESTYASAVWGYSRVPSADIDSVVGKGKRAADILVGGLMHNTERLTREIVYLAAYRLGKKRGLTTDEAINQAVADTNEALSDYDVSNRPLWMQKGLGKIAFQFKMYPLHMTLLALTSFKRMLPFLNKEGKLAAAQKFFGLMGTSATLAGASNMLFFSPIMSLVGWAWKQMEDDDELPEELKGKDPETWFRTVFLPDELGDIKLFGVPLSDIIDRGPVNAMTGLDVGSRTGLNDLLGRDIKTEKTARDTFTSWVLETFGGPTASLGLGMIDAYEAYAMGDYQKAMEKASPALIRNLIIANKYADEGIKNARGSELVPKEALTKGELFGQAIGFRPDRVANAQAQAFKLTGIEQATLNQRDRIMRMINIAHKKEDFDTVTKIIDTEVQKFNAKNPEYEIEFDDIYNSVFAQTELRNSAQAGVNLTEKNARLMQEAVENLKKSLERPAK